MSLLQLLAGVASTYLFIWTWLRVTQNDREPELVKTGIPFISPIFSLIRHNMGFYSYMRSLSPEDKGADAQEISSELASSVEDFQDEYSKLPIYTLRIPGVRLYIVNSTALIPIVQRQWRTLRFPPVQARAAKTAMGVSKDALAIMCEDMVTEDGFVPSFIKAIYPTLSGGDALNDLNSKSIEVILQTLDQFAADGPKTVKLYKWVTEQIFYATTDGIYGPHNPLRNSENYAAWLKYHPSIMFLMLDIIPLWMFKDNLRGREKLARAFRQYNEKKQYTEGSAYIQRWIEHLRSFNLSEDDISSFHVGGLFALVANTSPTAFWMVYRVFSDPDILKDCYNEVRKTVTEEDGVRKINASEIKNSCPILLSTFQEVFRIHGMGNSVRVASEDCILDSKYLIKKGGLLMIPSRVQHSDREIWGDDTAQFNYKRFVRASGTKRHNPVAFRGFGGGTTLCPGRHFATAEILLFVALLVLRFEVRPVSGQWVMPSREKSSQAEAMEQPDEDMEVEVVPQLGADNTWRVVFSESKEPELTAEDIHNQN